MTYTILFTVNLVSQNNKNMEKTNVTLYSYNSLEGNNVKIKLISANYLSTSFYIYVVFKGLTCKLCLAMFWTVKKNRMRCSAKCYRFFFEKIAILRRQ